MLYSVFVTLFGFFITLVFVSALSLLMISDISLLCEQPLNKFVGVVDFEHCGLFLC